MSKKKPAFEQSLRELEEVVAKMEHGELPLDECVQYYERGVKLAAACAHELDAARQRIEQLQKNEQGELVATPFAPDKSDPTDPSDPTDRSDPTDQSA
ncbi:MAG: exodeoxyribonuclease VII small subunit [bacterium]|nr:exodeoxyribonuclease VII small subunit [bacterium]